MEPIDILNIAGLILNIVGSIILTLSASKYLTSIHGALAIHDMQLKSLIEKSDKILSADVANLLKVGVEDSRKKTVAGFVITVIGFIVQLVPFLINALSKTGIFG